MIPEHRPGGCLRTALVLAILLPLSALSVGAVSHENIGSVHGDHTVFLLMTDECVRKYMAALDWSCRPTSVLNGDVTNRSIVHIMDTNTTRYLSYAARNASEMGARLESARDVLENIPANASSRSYLESYVLELYGMWENTTGLVNAQTRMISSISRAYMEGTNMSAATDMDRASQALAEMERHLGRLGVPGSAFGTSAAAINTSLSELARAMDMYWNIIELLTERAMLHSTELVLHLNATGSWIGGPVSVWGYLRFDGSIIRGQACTLNIGSLGYDIPPQNGSVFFFNTTLPIDIPTGLMPVNATCSYRGLKLVSVTTNLTITRIPVYLLAGDHPADISPDSELVIRVHIVAGGVPLTDPGPMRYRVGTGEWVDTDDPTIRIAGMGPEWGYHPYVVERAGSELYREASLTGGFNVNLETSLNLASDINDIHVGSPLPVGLELVLPPGAPEGMRRVTILVDGEPVMNTTLSSEGGVEVMGLTPGDHELQAVFISREAMLRNCTSGTLWVHVNAASTETGPALFDLPMTYWWTIPLLLILLVGALVALALGRKAPAAPPALRERRGAPEVTSKVKVSGIHGKRKTGDPVLEMKAAYLELLYSASMGEPARLGSATPREISTLLEKLGHPSPEVHRITHSIEGLLYMGITPSEREAENFVRDAKKLIARSTGGGGR